MCRGRLQKKQFVHIAHRPDVGSIYPSGNDSENFVISTKQRNCLVSLDRLHIVSILLRIFLLHNFSSQDMACTALPYSA